MCRRRDACRWSLLCFGLGILVGQWVDSWFLCGCMVALCVLFPLVRR